MSPNTPRKTILLVDDDEQVRAPALEVLRQQGYIVLEAASGEEALRLADETGDGKIHLLLTDVDLPSLNGPETARRIQASRPKIKVSLHIGELSRRDGAWTPQRHTSAKALHNGGDGPKGS